MTGAPRRLLPLDAQAKTYTDPSPDALLDHLNGLGTSVRVYQRAVADRDRVIDEQLKIIADRDEAIRLRDQRIRYAKIRIALLYAIVGGAAAKGAELVVIALAHFVVAWLRHHS